MVSNQAVLYAGELIATGAAKLESKLNKKYEFKDKYVKFDATDDIELFLAVVHGDRIDVKSKYGNIVGTYLTTQGGDIRLESKKGEIDVNYLSTGLKYAKKYGKVYLKAQKSLRLVETTYAGAQGLIQGYGDLNIDSKYSDIHLGGDVISLSKKIDVDAKGTLQVNGSMTAGYAIDLHAGNITVSTEAELTAMKILI